MRGWIGVDLDGTLAEYDGWKGPEHVGAPIPAMVERVKRWLQEGREVRIFTARAWPIGTLAAFDVAQEGKMRREEAERAVAAVRRWCETHIGRALPVTCVKDFGMIELWDDRAVQVRPNTGERADGA